MDKSSGCESLASARGSKTLVYVAKTIPFRYVRLLTLPKGVEIAVTWPSKEEL